MSTVFAGQFLCSTSTILRVSIVGDDQEHLISILVREAEKAFEWCAAEWDSNARIVDRRELRNALGFAARKAASAGPEQLAAAATLFLIQNRTHIFIDYPRSLPLPNQFFCGSKGFLPGAAHRFAEEIVKQTASDWPENEAASYHLRGVLADIFANAERDDFRWDESESALVEVLQSYRLPEHELWVRVRPDLGPGSDDGDEVSSETDSGVGGAPPASPTSAVAPQLTGPPTDHDVLEVGTTAAVASGGDGVKPVDRQEDPLKRLNVRAVVAVPLLMLVGALVAVMLFKAFPVAPRTLFGPTLVDSYPIPPLPEGPKELWSPTALPNTTVQLLLMSDGPKPKKEDQTTNGVLPGVAARQVSSTTDTVTFQVWLSVTDIAKNADTDKGLLLWINATTPMVVQGARLMFDPVNEGPEKPELDSVAKNGGVPGATSTAVEPLPRVEGAHVIYQFQVKSRPEDTSNAYACGFNPASVQVAVQVVDPANRGKPDSRKAVVTPYPLYVPRGTEC